MPATKIVFFNHKGGVGKTTLNYHVAAILGGLGKRVLLVDADPQCNLSAYTLEEGTLDQLLDRSESADGRTLWSAVRGVVSGTAPVRNVAPIKTSLPNVSILAGDIRLFEYENALGDMWADCSRRRERGFLGVTALSSVIAAACAGVEFDYVLFDVGPNIGSLNRSIVLDCDALVVPAGCDLFSARALKTLGAALLSWLTEWNALSQLAPPSFPRLSGMPELLGYTLHRFKVYGDLPTNEATKHIAAIRARVPTDLVGVFKNAPGARVHRHAAGNPVGEIKDFNRLAAMSQRERVPVFDLDGATPQERTTVKEQFSALVRRMRKRLGEEIGSEPAE